MGRQNVLLHPVEVFLLKSAKYFLPAELQTFLPLLLYPQAFCAKSCLIPSGAPVTQSDWWDQLKVEVQAVFNSIVLKEYHMFAF